MKTTKAEVLNANRTKKIMRVGDDFHSIQKALVLELFLENFGKEIPLNKVSKIKGINIYQYNTRIHELRTSGFLIENRLKSVTTTVEVFGKLVETNVKKSYFKLVGIV